MGKVVSIANSEHYNWGEGCDGWHLLKRDDVSIIQERIPPGKFEVKHYHNVSRQFFFILEGEAVMILDEDKITIQKGQGIEIPPEIKHQIRNDSNADVSFLVISFPKSHGDRVVSD